MRELLMFVFWFLAPQSVVQGLAVSASPESLLETQVLGLHLEPTESGSAFHRDSQVIYVYVKIWEVL